MWPSFQALARFQPSCRPIIYWENPFLPGRSSAPAWFCAVYFYWVPERNLLFRFLPIPPEHLYLLPLRNSIFDIRYSIFVIRYSLFVIPQAAQVAKLVDAPSSGGGAARCAGSNPVLGTKTPCHAVRRGFLFGSNERRPENMSIHQTGKSRLSIADK